MRTLRILLLHIFLAAVLIARAAAQEPAQNTAAPASAPALAKVPMQLVQKEMWIHAPLAFPNGLDALEVYLDRPGRHPLVVLTHGTSNNPEDRAHITPWSLTAQAQWFARRGYVALVVVRKGYASQLRMHGADLHEIQKLLGHSDPRMTSRYSHLSPDHLAAAASRLDGVLTLPESADRGQTSATPEQG
jgi:hypothetical protein